MNDMGFRELVEIAVEKLKDETIRQLLSDNAVYQKDCEMENEAEANYMQLDLTPEQKEICGHLLQCRDRQDYEYAKEYRAYESEMRKKMYCEIAERCEEYDRKHKNRDLER